MESGDLGHVSQILVAQQTKNMNKDAPHASAISEITKSLAVS